MKNPRVGLLLLVFVSLVWAFSFGLIKRYLAGLDSSFVAAARMLLAAMVFVPLLRPRGVDWGFRLRLLGVGAIQYGLMYMLYIEAYTYLKAWEVALFTIVTPFYITLLDDLLARRWHYRHHVAALLAVSGAVLIKYREPQFSNAMTGFLLIQGANLSFAFGQVAYRRLMKRVEGIADHRIFGYLFCGAVLITLPVAGLNNGLKIPSLSLVQIGVLLYLGIFAAGVCFFLWNHGARLVDAGTLAVCNNLKVPLAVMIALICFGETVALISFLPGTALILLAFLFTGRR